MGKQGKALISKQFMEVTLKIPVILRPARMEAVETGIKEYFPDFIRNGLPFFITRSMAEPLQPGTLYHMADLVSLHYSLFLYGGNNQVFTAGPCLVHPADATFCEQILQNNGKSLPLLVPFSQFRLTLPVVGNSQILEMTRTAIRVITGTNREIPYLHYKPQRHYTQEISDLSTKGVDETSMELLGHRYYYEELLLWEAAQDSQNLALEYYRRFSQESQAIVRTEDPLRVAENLGFFLNTMLHKNAETAGTHPMYLDIISSNFAMLIENAGIMRETQECKPQMISVYCHFVRKNRLDQYSPLVHKTITYIRIHPADQLTLARVARGIRVSPFYLSRLLNRETGDFISNCTTKARVEKAAGLLPFSGISVQNIAFYVGLRDLNYFNRYFKKYKRMMPTKYKASSSIEV